MSARRFEDEEILYALEATEGNKDAAARLLYRDDRAKANGNLWSRMAALQSEQEISGVFVAKQERSAEHGPQWAPDRSLIDTEIPPGEPVTLPVVGRVVVISDLHAPYHDERAWSCMLNALSILRPEGIVIIGDFVDCYSVTQFDRDPKRRADLAWEIGRARELLGQIPQAKWRVYLEGNHEFRLQRYLRRNAPALDGMLSVQKELGLAELGWKWVPISSHAHCGKMSYHHGWRFGIYAMRQTLLDWGGNISFGHTHRMGAWYGGTVRGEDHVCVNVGWLGDPRQIDYRMQALVNRDWQQGFSVDEFEEDGTVHAHAVPMVRWTCMVGSRRITA